MPIRFEQVSKEDYIKILLMLHHTSEAFANSLTDMLTAIGNALYDTEPREQTSIERVTGDSFKREY